jgi:hypothetical protein
MIKVFHFIITYLHTIIIAIITFIIAWFIFSLFHPSSKPSHSQKPIVVTIEKPIPKPDTIIKFLDRIFYKEVKPETIYQYNEETIPPLNFISSVEKRKTNLRVKTFQPTAVSGDTFIGTPREYPLRINQDADYTLVARTNDQPPKLIVRRQFPIRPEFEGSILWHRKLSLLIQPGVSYKHFLLGGFLHIGDSLSYGIKASYKL